MGHSLSQQIWSLQTLTILIVQCFQLIGSSIMLVTKDFVVVTKMIFILDHPIIIRIGFMAMPNNRI